MANATARYVRQGEWLPPRHRIEKPFEVWDTMPVALREVDASRAPVVGRCAFGPERTWRSVDGALYQSLREGDEDVDVTRFSRIMENGTEDEAFALRQPGSRLSPHGNVPVTAFLRPPVSTIDMSLASSDDRDDAMARTARHIERSFVVIDGIVHVRTDAPTLTFGAAARHTTGVEIVGGIERAFMIDVASTARREHHLWNRVSSWSLRRVHVPLDQAAALRDILRSAGAVSYLGHDMLEAIAGSADPVPRADVERLHAGAPLAWRDMIASKSISSIVDFEGVGRAMRAIDAFERGEATFGDIAMDWRQGARGLRGGEVFDAVAVHAAILVVSPDLVHDAAPTRGAVDPPSDDDADVVAAAFG